MTPLGTEDPRSIGDYTLLGRLGAGGMGVVYLGVSPSGRQVAVKFVRGPYAQEEEFRARFRQEVAAARRVSGAFTASVVDADPDADRPWMATLYVPGPTLADVVKAPSLDEYCTASALGGASYALCSDGTEPGRGPVDLEKLEPGSLTEIATLPTGAEALGVVGGQPVFLAPQTTKQVYEAGYERPYNALLRVDLETGQVERTALARPLTGTATLVDGVVYFVRSNGSVTAVSADSGRQLWQKATDMEYLSVPAVSATYRRVYFSNRFGRLLALDSRTGGEVWRTSALDDAGDKAVTIPPSVLLVKDAIVATAGDTAFSRSPDVPAS